MSSVNHNLSMFIASVTFAILMSAPISAQDAVHEVVLSCPATIDVLETASPTSGWQGSSATGKRKFERISIYNGTNGGREFELAPDDQKEERGRTTQIWHLGGYRTMNMFLRCRYSGTQVVLSKDIPDRFKTCIFAFDSEKSGKISGTSSFACR